MFCKKCGKHIDSDSDFCRYCGASVRSEDDDSDVRICSFCKKPLRPEWQKCPNCQHADPLYNGTESADTNKTDAEASKKTKKSSARKITGTLAAIAAAAAAAAMIVVPQYHTDFIVTELNDGTVSISGYTGSGGDITIPEKLHFKTVTAIGDNAFSNNDTITEIVLPDGIRTIGASAFQDCDRLFQVIMTNSVESIGQLSFDGCDNLVTVTGYGFDVNGDPIRSNLHLKTIGAAGFSNCPKLANIISADHISDIAYANCISLKGGFRLETSSIGMGAFSRCTEITAVEITADEVDETAFELCTKLKDKNIIIRSEDDSRLLPKNSLANTIGGSGSSSHYSDMLTNTITNTSADNTIETVADSIAKQSENAAKQYAQGRSALQLPGLTKKAAFELLVHDYTVTDTEWGSRMYWNEDSKLAFMPNKYTGRIDKVIVYSGGCLNWKLKPSHTYEQLFETLGEHTLIRDDAGKYGFVCKYDDYILSFIGSSDSLSSSPEMCYVCLA